MGLNAGDRDREVTYQTATKTQDADTGEEVIDWTTADALTLYVQWLPGTARETYFAQQRLEARIDGVFRIEPIDRPDPASNRIIFDGRTYDIQGVTEVERMEGWELAVSARG